jgi:hypothetical protein
LGDVVGGRDTAGWRRHPSNETSALLALSAVGRTLGLDPPSTALDATAVIWTFFAANSD